MHMLEDNDDIRPHDWLEAEKMVGALRTRNCHFKSRLHRSIKWMVDENMPFDDDGFREMLENAFFSTMNNGERDPHCSIVSNILSEDVNDHPIDRFHELLSCIRMHDIGFDAGMMMPVWYAHELMKRNNITEYDDHETGVLLWKLANVIRMRPCDDEIILKTKLIDVIMQSCGDDIDLRGAMMRIAFPDPSRGEDVPIMLTAVRSYFTSEPDYQDALSIFDDTTRSRFFRRYKKGYRKISRMAFRRMLKSCGGNANAMSGFMHTVIEIHKAAHYNRRFADSLAVLASYWDSFLHDDFICPNPDAMRMMLANLAEGYPVEYITELIISENDWR